MAKQAVNTERVAATASRLHTVDDNINGAFSVLKKKAGQFQNEWRGAAGTAAQTTMYQLLKDNEQRSAVLKNYIGLLECQVNPGYSGAETTNKKLADNFK